MVWIQRIWGKLQGELRASQLPGGLPWDWQGLYALGPDSCPVPLSPVPSQMWHKSSGSWEVKSRHLPFPGSADPTHSKWMPQGYCNLCTRMPYVFRLRVARGWPWPIHPLNELWCCQLGVTARDTTGCDLNPPCPCTQIPARVGGW